MEVRRGLGTRPRKLAFDERASLRAQHRPEVAAAKRDPSDEDEHENRIESKGNGFDERHVCVAFDPEVRELVFDVANLYADPRRDQCQACDGRSGCIDEKGELLSTDAKAVGDGTHRGANEKRVGVVVEEDQQPEEPSGQLAPPTARRVGAHPGGESFGAAALGHQSKHPTEQQAEDQDRRVPWVGDRTDDVRVEQARKRRPRR